MIFSRFGMMFSRFGLLSLCFTGAALHVSAAETLEYAIAIHGGAGSGPEQLGESRTDAIKKSLTAALLIGKKVLNEGGTSLDAVERVIRYLEDDTNFNAGRGAVFNAAGGHELDASIMDGRTKACGAVASIRTVKNPISLARLVMTETRHVLLGAEGAEQFAGQMGVDRVDGKYFSTKRQFDNWQRSRQGRKESSQTTDTQKGTVGCVALDRRGNLAAGTSTGGLTNKRFGRIGDSPIIGAGTYADNATCAVSCTGVGEHFIRNAVAFDVSAQMAYRQMTLEESVNEILQKKLKPGHGGIIAVAHDGTLYMDYNTKGMSRAAADAKGLFQVKIGR